MQGRERAESRHWQLRVLMRTGRSLRPGLGTRADSVTGRSLTLDLLDLPSASITKVSATIPDPLNSRNLLYIPLSPACASPSATPRSPLELRLIPFHQLQPACLTCQKRHRPRHSLLIRRPPTQDIIRMLPSSSGNRPRRCLRVPHYTSCIRQLILYIQSPGLPRQAPRRQIRTVARHAHCGQRVLSRAPQAAFEAYTVASG
jgi:hypothetical protein